MSRSRWYRMFHLFWEDMNVWRDCEILSSLVVWLYFNCSFLRLDRLGQGGSFGSTRRVLVGIREDDGQTGVLLPVQRSLEEELQCLPRDLVLPGEMLPVTATGINEPAATADTADAGLLRYASFQHLRSEVMIRIMKNNPWLLSR